MMSQQVIIVFTSFWLLFFTCTAEISPFSPPFLRATGDKSPASTFNYLRPQPRPLVPLLQDGIQYQGVDIPVSNVPLNPISPPYGKADHNVYSGDATDEFHPNLNVPDEDPYDSFMDPNPSAPNEYMPGNSGVGMDSHIPYNHHLPPAPLPLSALTNNKNFQRNAASTNPVGRPQLRQLEIEKPPPPNKNLDSNAVSARNSRLNISNNHRRNNRPSNHRVSEGHRLITRALWRIFDALMERNEKEELHGRMAFVESAIKDMITSDSKLEGLVEMIKEENMGQQQLLEQLGAELAALRGLQSRLDELEGWRMGFERQQDQQPQTEWRPKPAYSSCPSPFETVEGECFYVAGEMKKSWQDARRDCSKYGGDLAAPQNLESLRTYLQSLAYQPEYVWVGASILGNGDWVWTAGTQEGQKVDMGPSTWNEDLPNGLGNCMGLYEGAAYRAYDYHCSEQDLYVCQFFL